MYCVSCRNYLNPNYFLDREDKHSGKYAFCAKCMILNGRSLNYPKRRKRGGGLIYRDYDE